MGALLQIFHSGSSNMGHTYVYLDSDFFGTYYWNMVGSEQAIRVKREYFKALLDQ